MLVNHMAPVINKTSGVHFAMRALIKYMCMNISRLRLTTQQCRNTKATHFSQNVGDVDFGVAEWPLFTVYWGCVNNARR